MHPLCCFYDHVGIMIGENHSQKERRVLNHLESTGIKGSRNKCRRAESHGGSPTRDRFEKKHCPG